VLQLPAGVLAGCRMCARRGWRRCWCSRVAAGFLLTRRGAEQASMPSGVRGRRVGSNGVRFLMGFRTHCLQVRRAHVTFAAAQLASCGASNTTPNARVCALGMVLCLTHVSLFIAHDQIFYFQGHRVLLNIFSFFLSFFLSFSGSENATDSLRTQEIYPCPLSRAPANGENSLHVLWSALHPWAVKSQQSRLPDFQGM